MLVCVKLTTNQQIPVTLEDRIGMGGHVCVCVGRGDAGGPHQAQQLTTVTLALGRLRQENHCQPGLYIEFWASLNSSNPVSNKQTIKRESLTKQSNEILYHSSFTFRILTVHYVN